MLSHAASAPGKLIIAGEYAVLDGAPAIVMAVNRRAFAHLSAQEPRRDEERSALLAAVCATLGMAAPGPVLLETDVFRTAGGVKLGLGSSAALTAALCRLLLPPDTGRNALFLAARAAHRRFQAGLGSGADIAASVAGGIVHYRMTDAAIELLDWPEGLLWSAWWSGVAASTPAKLADFSALPRSAERDALASAAGHVAESWAGDAPALLAVLEQYVAVLADFDRRHGLEVFSAGHGELVAVARNLGVVYKPSGAGGGDVGLAFASEAAALHDFALVATAAGYRHLELAVDPRGAALERAAA